MTLICWLIGHVPMSAHYHVQGLEFALCGRCGLDLIRRGHAEWQPLGKGDEAGQEIAEPILVAPMPPRRTPPRRHTSAILLARGYDMRQREARESKKRPEVQPPIEVETHSARSGPKRGARARSYRRWWLTHRDGHRGEQW